MPRFCANLTMMFNEVPFLDRFAAAAGAGFEAVEMLFPYEEAPETVRDTAAAAGVKVALFNTPAGSWEAGERGLAAVPGREADFRAAFAKALAYAKVLQPDCIHVMSGLAAGAEAEATLIANLKWAVAEAGAQKLCIEPINTRDIPGYFLNTTGQTMPIIDAVGAPNLGLQFDLYHVQIMEGDLTRRMERLISSIYHVQLAGVPDRHEPDVGEMNLDHVMGVLDRLGYGGWVGCEYRPAGSTRDGLGWFERFR